MRGLRFVRCRRRWHSVSGNGNRFPLAALPVPPSLIRTRFESRPADDDFRLDRSKQNTDVYDKHADETRDKMATT